MEQFRVFENISFLAESHKLSWSKIKSFSLPSSKKKVCQYGPAHALDKLNLRVTDNLATIFWKQPTVEIKFLWKQLHRERVHKMRTSLNANCTLLKVKHQNGKVKSQFFPNQHESLNKNNYVCAWRSFFLIKHGTQKKA